MLRIKAMISQAAALVVIGTGVAFIYNGFSESGLNPFREIEEVPLFNNRERGSGQESEGIKIISLQKTLEMIEEGAAIVDARNREEYEEGHIPGAHLVSYYDMSDYLDRVVDILTLECEIIVYCTGINCEGSKMLARELYLIGYRKLFVFDGGYEKWVDEGLPVEEGEYQVGY